MLHELVAGPFVTTQWLAVHLGEPGLVVVDASWHMPASGRDPSAEFEKVHIPGAVFFDIDRCSDEATDLPHMLPGADAFSGHAGSLGITRDSTIVVYDSSGLFSAARAWWTFRAFGAASVRVLDGGLPLWLTEGRPTQSGPAVTMRAEFDATGPEGVADIGDVCEALTHGSAQLLDARAAQRFRGEAAEPRPGLKSGHMRGSLNLPFEGLVAGGRMLPATELVRAFERVGVNLDDPIITTCGSGVTAAVLSLGLAVLDRESRLYDGSWAEWGRRDDTDIVTG